MKKRDTSWEHVALWYDDLLEHKEGTYQKEVILPNLLRLLTPSKGQTILDLACGQGFFSREFHKAGATVIGTDLSKELVEIARKNSPKEITYHVSGADNLCMIDSASVDVVTIVLALQNIENIAGTFTECSRVLKPQGRLFVVLNHPAFRIPKASGWGYDDAGKVQYRRIDRYLSESREKIDMNPGEKDNKSFTYSFHRPLQLYFKTFAKNGFAVTRLEEWISHKESEPGPRQDAENTARKEIPLFLFLEAVKM
ncbi:MAG TPA: class I SAM-dependent methyltransferase [Candidatus Paceibacterota bacterium]